MVCKILFAIDINGGIPSGCDARFHNKKKEEVYINICPKTNVSCINK